jgi:hypothetical protein
MTRVLMILALALSLTGCALFKSEAWAKQILLPNASTDSTACNKGVQAGSARQELGSFGTITFKPPQGSLGFSTRISQVYLLCYATGLIIGRKPDNIPDSFSTSVRIEDDTTTRAKIRVEISLEQDGNEIVRLTESEIETEGTAKTWYSFKRLSAAQQTALETANSFTIIVNRGAGEERYAVNPTNLPGL